MRQRAEVIKCPSQDEKGAYSYIEVRASNNRNSLFYTNGCKEYFSENLELCIIFTFTKETGDLSNKVYKKVLKLFENEHHYRMGSVFEDVVQIYNLASTYYDLH